MTYTKQTWADFVSGTPTANQTANAARLQHIEDGIAAETADLVKSKSGVGGFTIVRDGIDASTGAANELILSQSFSDFIPPGLDLDGGQIGCSLADPVSVLPPATSLADESGGDVVIISGNTSRFATRVRLFSDRIDNITWYVTGDTTSLTTSVSVADPGTGATLYYGTTTLTPSTIPTGGVPVTHTLSTPLTGLTLQSVVVVFQTTMAGTARLAGRGIAGAIQPTSGLRVDKSLFRAGGKGTNSAVNSSTVFDFDTGTGSGGYQWTKRPVPLLILHRTS